MSNVISIERSNLLNDIAEENNKGNLKVATGLDEASIRRFNNNKKTLLKYFKASNEDFDDYKWQLSHRIIDVEVLDKILELTKKEEEEIINISKKYRWSVSPYYLCLMDKKDKLDPLKLMSVPNSLEDSSEGETDPMKEEFTNPAGTITRRYPDRLIINVTNVCPMYCRHCQRKRNFGECDKHTDMKLIDESIDFVKKNKTIRDVLITGGDPLSLPDDALEEIVKKIRAIKHVEIIRIGTRIPVTMPQRITKDLVKMLKKYHPLYINLQFNHPREITPESKEACAKLADAGIPLGNQSVLLNGINNDKYVQMVLNRKLNLIRVKPYYLFHAKNVKGTMHFNTSIKDGLEIMKYLRGNTSGLAIPTYILNSANGLGKIPLLPEYVVSNNNDVLTLRTWEGKTVEYADAPTIDFEKAFKNRIK
ncbi:MAG: KamA family radical SAM protein [Bacilli bacterium]|nr:KamA family radical SAM protein [Bacilli bacterium]